MHRQPRFLGELAQEPETRSRSSPRRGRSRDPRSRRAAGGPRPRGRRSRAPRPPGSWRSPTGGGFRAERVPQRLAERPSAALATASGPPERPPAAGRIRMARHQPEQVIEHGKPGCHAGLAASSQLDPCLEGLRSESVARSIARTRVSQASGRADFDRASRTPARSGLMHPDAHTSRYASLRRSSDPRGGSTRRAGSVVRAVRSGHRRRHLRASHRSAPGARPLSGANRSASSGRPFRGGPARRSLGFVSGVSRLSGIASVETPERRFSASEPGLTAMYSAGVPYQWQYTATRVGEVPDAVLRAAAGVKIAVIDTGADVTAPTSPPRLRRPTTSSTGARTSATSTARDVRRLDRRRLGVERRGNRRLRRRREAAPHPVRPPGRLLHRRRRGRRDRLRGQPRRQGHQSLDRRDPDIRAREEGAGLCGRARRPRRRPRATSSRPATRSSTRRRCSSRSARGPRRHRLSVGATTKNGSRASFSNTGSWISLAAPGENVLGALSSYSRSRDWPRYTLPGSSHGIYGFSSGTSFSAPQVAGAAALVWAANPALNRDQVAWILKRTASGDGRWTKGSATACSTSAAPSPRRRTAARSSRRRGRPPPCASSGGTSGGRASASGRRSPPGSLQSHRRDGASRCRSGGTAAGIASRGPARRPAGASS